MHQKQEHRIQLAAARRGLRLIRNRYRVSGGGDLYCLRATWQPAWVVGTRSDGGVGLVYALTRREEIGSWLTLSEIERLLANWSEPAMRAWGEATSAHGINQHQDKGTAPQSLASGAPRPPHRGSYVEGSEFPGLPRLSPSISASILRGHAGRDWRAGVQHCRR